MNKFDSKLDKLTTSKAFFVSVVIFWLIVFVVGGTWFWQYRNATVERSEQQQAVEAECKQKGGDFRLYYDNGSTVPVCREPKTDSEMIELQRSRAYREGLRNGDIDPDYGDASGLNEFPR